MMMANDKHGDIHDYCIYPLVIIGDRYSGAYSGGIFTAWNLYPENIPTEIFSDDDTASEFWSHEAKHDYRGEYGVGNTIQEAIDSLYYNMKNPFIRVRDNLWLPKSQLMDLHDINGPLGSVSKIEQFVALHRYKRNRKKFSKEERR